jgi:hypothetical protein
VLLLKPRHRAIVVAAADRLPDEKRRAFIDRLSGRLRLRQYQSTSDAIGDADLVDEIQRTLRGLIWATVT